MDDVNSMFACSLPLDLLSVGGGCFYEDNEDD